jgi:hypothetical protein
VGVPFKIVVRLKLIGNVSAAMAFGPERGLLGALE